MTMNFFALILLVTAIVAGNADPNDGQCSSKSGLEGKACGVDRHASPYTPDDCEAGEYAKDVKCHTEKTCRHNDQVYIVGETFPSNDNCNTCWCTEEGTVACTKRTCLNCPEPVPRDLIDNPLEVIPERRLIVGNCHVHTARCPVGSCILTYRFKPRTKIQIDIPCPVYGVVAAIYSSERVDCGPQFGLRNVHVATSCVCVKDPVDPNMGKTARKPVLKDDVHVSMTLPEKEPVEMFKAGVDFL